MAPIYEYECLNGHLSEAWVRLNEVARIRHCATCGAYRRRIMSVARANFDATSTPSDFRDRRRESDYDRNLASAFPMQFAIDKAGKGVKK